jgi:hypothetical protein
MLPSNLCSCLPACFAFIFMYFRRIPVVAKLFAWPEIIFRLTSSNIQGTDNCLRCKLRTPIAIAQSILHLASHCTIGVLGFDYRQVLGIFLFTTTSRPALGPTQPPIQWVPGALSLGVKRPGCEADHSPPSVAEVKNAWSYTSTPPVRLHGVVRFSAQGQLCPSEAYILLRTTVTHWGNLRKVGATDRIRGSSVV